MHTKNEITSISYIDKFIDIMDNGSDEDVADLLTILEKHGVLGDIVKPDPKMMALAEELTKGVELDEESNSTPLR